MAVLGGLALVAAVLAGLAGQTPRPAWLPRFFIGWAVLVPYWWYLEYRLFCPRGGEGRVEFLALQNLSRQVWLGGLAALAALLWWRGA